ncbi:uncharacterized protein LOC118757425 [Rhagoletis pomonella]|uniref:uncharacterized protein LOC118757425 n=1 Tax=Rhagoletis pomonella TaxID=28610 RepID=UPI00178565AD|nr:uncharacterized protein LOC118757425 [Rhagoletis pomonella]
MLKRGAHRKNKNTSSVYTNIKDNYDIRTRKYIKRYQNGLQQITRLAESTKFLETCRRSGLTPNFISNATKNILYTINNNTSNNRIPTQLSNAVTAYINKVQLKLVNLIIRIKHSLRRQIAKEVNRLETLITQQLNINDSTVFFESEKLLTNKLTTTIKKTQTKKYEKLKQKQKQLLNIRVIPEWFCNKTTINIPIDIQWLLSLGPKYALPTENKNFPLFQFIADGENCIQTITDKEKQEIERNNLTTLIRDHLNIITHYDKSTAIQRTRFRNLRNPT